MDTIELTRIDSDAMAVALANLAAAGFTFTEVDRCADPACTEASCSSHPLAA